jgi:hypothetical protein
MYGEITLGRYVTNQVMAQIDVAHQLDDVPMRTAAVRKAQDMMAHLEDGVKQVPAWVQRRIKQFDPLLSMRFDYEMNCFVLDIFVKEWGFHGTITALPGWRHSERDIERLLEDLRFGDLQRWPSPQAYVEAKRERAARVRQENDQRSTDNVLAAVDSLSDAQIKQHIEVSRAIRVGERVRPLGEDAKTLERMAEAGKKSPAPPKHAINPGMHPKVYKRKRERILA